MKRKNTVTLAPEHQTRIKEIIAAQGVYQAAKHLGMSRHAMERAAQGSTIQAGPAALLREQFAKRDAEGKTP